MRLNRLNGTAKEGDFAFTASKNAIWIKMPNDIGPIRIPLTGKGAWRWDGSMDNPTLTPSILVHPSDMFGEWHGWMRKGKLVSV